MRIIVGVDPGLATGLLAYDILKQRVELASLPPLDAADWVEARLGNRDVCACERFTPRTRTGSMTRQNDALEVIGMVRRISHRAGAVFILENASDAARLASREVLQALGWWRRGDPDHVRRAAAQAAAALARRRPAEYELITRPGMMTTGSPGE